MRRTTWKQVLCLVLALALLASFSAVFAESSVPHYDTYVCLGDSIASGFGPDADSRHGCEKVEHAYHTKVAKGVGAKEFIQMAYPAMRTHELRNMLDESYEGDTAMYALMSFVNDHSMEEWRNMYAEAIKKADLITLDVGTNDFFSIPLFTALAALRAESPLDLSYITDQLDQETSMGKLVAKIAGLAQEGANIPTALPKYLTTLQTCCEGFMENWDAICKIIYELNPDVELVAVSRMNPFYTVKLTDADLVQVGRLLDIICIAMNNFVKNQSAYASRYIYADVMGTECYQVPALTDDNFLANLTVHVHPTHAGHDYMTSQILKALEQEGSGMPEPAEEPEQEEPGKQEPVEEPEQEEPVFPFTDVPRTSWYYPEVYYVWSHNLMSGMSDTIFAPEANTTRAQFVQVLYRLAGAPAVDKSDLPFTDLKADWYRDAIAWAYKNGIASGTSKTTFSPDQVITRQQMVAMIYHYKGDPKANGDLSKFKDGASVSGYAKQAMIWAVDNKVISGFEDGTIRPTGAATRAQLATILHQLDLMG